jgi:hypothetical protein
MLLLQFAHHLIEIVVQLEPARKKGLLAKWKPQTVLQAAFPNGTFSPFHSDL